MLLSFYLPSPSASVGATWSAHTNCRRRHGEEEAHFPMRASEGSSSEKWHSGLKHCSYPLPKYIRFPGNPVVELGGYTEISGELCLGICMKCLWEIPLSYIGSMPISQQSFILSCRSHSQSSQGSGSASMKHRSLAQTLCMVPFTTTQLWWGDQLSAVSHPVPSHPLTHMLYPSLRRGVLKHGRIWESLVELLKHTNVGPPSRPIKSEGLGEGPWNWWWWWAPHVILRCSQGWESLDWMRNQSPGFHDFLLLEHHYVTFYLNQKVQPLLTFLRPSPMYPSLQSHLVLLSVHRSTT